MRRRMGEFRERCTPRLLSGCPPQIMLFIWGRSSSNVYGVGHNDAGPGKTFRPIGGMAGVHAFLESIIQAWNLATELVKRLVIPLVCVIYITIQGDSFNTFRCY